MLKKFIYVSMAVLCLLLSLYAAEQITDGGMEAWDDATHLTNWTLTTDGGSLDREGTIKHGGTYSAKVTQATGYVWLRQSFTMTAGAAYTISFWYRYGAADQHFLYEIFDSGTNQWLKSDASQQASEAYTLLGDIGTTWTEYTLSFNAHASYTDYVISFQKYDNDNVLYVDDVSITDTEAEEGNAIFFGINFGDSR